ncbi:hypothetical protein [Brevibacillus sp. DP1.3A]|uniref:hypothetical protein n=1 Tax=Brevibacillus sp. DP1.3A TaxID=2738867 RepID=UPI00156BC025|nr:hypothetical protein [Brevibacillus sp. DP1.3A]UED76084.1 hypothetical protein HP399_006205 [Brevibacillus sp. DP1.3A]
MEPSEVITYRLSPEEMERLMKGDKTTMGAAPKTKKDLTKDVYLKLIKQGKLDSHIRKEYGLSSWTQLKRMKENWGIAGGSGAEEKQVAVPVETSLEQVMARMDEMAAEHAETKKQLNGIGEILTQLTQKINSPNTQYIQNDGEKSNDQQVNELIRKLLKELL